MKKQWSTVVVRDLFEAHRNTELAKPMEAYMKNHFPFLGIKSPERKELLKEVFKTYELPVVEKLEHVVWELYACKEREYHYIAIAVLDKMKKHLTIEHHPFLRRLIETNSWWDSVDAIAPICGYIVKKERERGSEVMRDWSKTANMWTNRVAIIHQLKFRTDTDASLLFECILRHIKSEEFFLQKAIGWSLRQYAKTEPDQVLQFVSLHSELKPLSRREALKHL